MLYPTDTNRIDSDLNLICDIDVLVHECNFPEEISLYCHSTGHSHPSEVANIVKST